MGHELPTLSMLLQPVHCSTAQLTSPQEPQSGYSQWSSSSCRTKPVFTCHLAKRKRPYILICVESEYNNATFKRLSIRFYVRHGPWVRLKLPFAIHAACCNAMLNKTYRKAYICILINITFNGDKLSWPSLAVTNTSDQSVFVCSQ